MVDCHTFISRIATPGNSQLLIHSDNIIKRVADLADQVKQTNLEPECGADHLVVSSYTIEDCASYLTSLCTVSTLPYAPNCIVKAPLAINKYFPVCITIILKDREGLIVPNQKEHLTLQFKDYNVALYVSKEENRDSTYILSYKSKRIETHEVEVLWKDYSLKRVTIPICIRDYTAVQQEKLFINKYSPDDKELVHPHLLAVGSNGELIVRDYKCQLLVVFDNQLQYLHSIGDGRLNRPTGIYSCQ